MGGLIDNTYESMLVYEAFNEGWWKPASFMSILILQNAVVGVWYIYNSWNDTVTPSIP